MKLSAIFLKRLVPCALAVACAAPAAAAGPRCDGPLSLERVAERVDARFAALDADDNGSVTRAEFDAAASEHPGRGKAWGHRHHQGRHGEHGGRAGHDAEASAQRRSERLRSLFAALDVDGTGQLSATEFARLHETGRALHQNKVFAWLDTDANNTLSATEFGAKLSRMREGDADGDGQLSCAERRLAR